MNTTTHIATNKWTVGPYTFLEAMPKVGTANDEPAYWAMKGDELLSRSSFSTIEEAMQYAANDGRYRAAVDKMRSGQGQGGSDAQ